MKYKVTWKNLFSKNCNNRKYSKDCFEHAIKQLNDGYLPVYIDADSTEIIGYAYNFQLVDDSMSVEINIADNFIEVLKHSEPCISGHGDTIWRDDNEQGYAEIDANTYEFICIYLSKKSTFTVDVRPEFRKEFRRGEAKLISRL